MLWRLLDPRQGWIAFTFFSHKILRWLCPFFMLGLLVVNPFLWQDPYYQGALVAHAGWHYMSTGDPPLTLVVVLAVLGALGAMLMQCGQR